MLVITEENFQEVVLASDKPVVVDFWAEWCMPCKMFAPTFAELAEELEESVCFGKFDVEGHVAIPREYKVMSIPSIILFKGGEVIKKHSGVMQKEELEAWIREEI